MNQEELKEKYPKFVEFGKDYVVVMVDDDEETFTIQDVLNYGANGMSGMRCFGPVYGDWRMIECIYEDVFTYFENEHPELLFPEGE